MRTLTYTPRPSLDFECPPKDTYVLEVLDFGDFEDKDAYNDPSTTNTQSRISFKVVDFEYDPDVDEQDWNGTEVADYFVFFKEFDNKKGERVSSDTWRSEKSKAFELLSALLGRAPEDGEDIQLEELVGTRVKATVEPKESGWPKISNFVADRRKKRKATPVVDADDAGVFDESAA